MCQGSAVRVERGAVHDRVYPSTSSRWRRPRSRWSLRGSASLGAGVAGAWPLASPFGSGSRTPSRPAAGAAKQTGHTRAIAPDQQNSSPGIPRTNGAVHTPCEAGLVAARPAPSRRFRDGPQPLPHALRDSHIAGTSKKPGSTTLTGLVPVIHARPPPPCVRRPRRRHRVDTRDKPAQGENAATASATKADRRRCVNAVARMRERGRKARGLGSEAKQTNRGLGIGPWRVLACLGDRHRGYQSAL